VDRELARAGARTGDEVLIGPLAFDYEPDEAIAPAASASHPGRSNR